MRSHIHPEYREVLFHDTNADVYFIIGSTLQTQQTKRKEKHDHTNITEPGHDPKTRRETVAKPPHLKQTQKSTCKDAFRHIS